MENLRGGFMNTAKKFSNSTFTQFELTTQTVRNLGNYKLTSSAKLVLVLLTTHFNDKKNGAVVFPSISYISETLGIGLTSTKQAINDLVKNGLILKSKRNKIKGNYNEYLLTLKVQNSTCEQSENELFEQSENDLFHEVTNKSEQKKEQNKLVGDNMYSEENQILINYAKAHGAKNIRAYVAKLKLNGSAKKIINEQKTIHNGLCAYEQTQKLIEQYKEDSKHAVSPETIPALAKFREYAKRVNSKTC